MLSGIFLKFSNPTVGFKKSPQTDSASQENNSPDELNKLAWDAQKTTLELELDTKQLHEEDIKKLAKCAMKNDQVETYLMIASKYPDVVTPKFTDQVMHEMKPDNQFVTPLKMSGYPATIFSENNTKKIATFKSHCTQPSYYVVSTGELHDFSEFKSCSPTRM